MFVKLRGLGLAAVLLVTAACGGGSPENSPGKIPASASTDIAYGDPNAPLTLIEYVAITCGACGSFYNQTMSEIKPKYVDTGKLKVISREILFVPPAEVNLAGFAVARCAGDDKFYDVLDDMFKNQTGILSAVRAGAGTQALQAVAARHGLDKAAYEACIADPDTQQIITKISEDATLGGVRATPALYLNGRELKGASARTAEGLAELLDAELAKSE